MLKKIGKIVIYAAAAFGLWLGGREAYSGVKWIRESHAQAHILWTFLAEPIAKTQDGKVILRGDVIDTLIRERLNTPAAPAPSK